MAERIIGTFFIAVFSSIMGSLVILEYGAHPNLLASITAVVIGTTTFAWFMGDV
jgi:hypothetical protein